VSKSVTFTLALPVVQFVVHVPLVPVQEASATAVKTRMSSDHFEFMQTPQ
jgi:hypothetical protein